MRVQTHHMLEASKGADQHHQGALGQMKVGDEAVDPLKFKAWRDEDVGVALGLA